MKKRKGASTILVLFMVIVLITLGLFTIVSANVNYKLSQKSDGWSSTYYDLVKVCEFNLGKVEEILLLSEQEAVKKTIETYSAERDESVETTIVDPYEFMNNIYKSIAVEKLSELAAANNFSTLDVSYDNFENIDNLEYAMVIKSEYDEDYEIQVVLEVKDILYDLSYSNGKIAGKKKYYESRSNIKKWKQYQNIQVKFNGIEVWDPTENIEFDIVSPNGDVGGTWDPTEEIEIVD